MIIYESTYYIDLSKQKDVWYQLEVTNMFDFKTKSICERRLDNKTTIRYNLKKNIPISENTYNSYVVESLTEEMKIELDNMGYLVYDFNKGCDHYFIPYGGIYSPANQKKCQDCGLIINN